MRYPKRSIVVQAYQMTEERTRRRSQWPFWLQEAWLVDRMWFEDPSRFMLETLEGPVEVAHGDWIIQGITGELYPCKPDIFEANYEKEESDPEYHTACIRRTMKSKKPVQITVIFSDPAPLMFCGEPYAHRRVTVDLTEEQAEALKIKQYESPCMVFLEFPKIEEGRDHEK